MSPARLLRRFGVRARLLTAFGFLLALMFAIASIAWIGFTQLGDAVKELQRESLLDVERALRLAQQSSSLAARAPAVASARVLAQIDSESAELHRRLGAFKQLLAEFEGDGLARNKGNREEMARLRDAGANLAQTLLELMQVSRESVFHVSQVRALRYRLDQLDTERLRVAGLSDSGNAALDYAIRMMGDAIDDEAADAEAQRARFNRLALPALQAWHPAMAGANLAAELIRLGTQTPGVYDAVEDRNEDQVRRIYLLSVVAALAGGLADEVAANVEHVRRGAVRRGETTERALAENRTRIAILGALGLIAAALAATYVVRDLGGQIGAVTSAMRRLAEGDRSVDVPGLGRPDEIGTLARAFEVFREHAARLDQTTRLLETVFEHMNDGVAVFDASGRLRACNQRVSELYGSREVLRPGMSLQAVRRALGAEDSVRRSLSGDPLDAAYVDRARQYGRQRFEEYLPNGHVLELRSTLMPDGGFVTVYTDLTERKATEAQLAQARKMESVGQLTGGMAHDFNNLLAAIIGNLQVVLDDAEGLPPERRRYLERALASAERGSGITQRLLAFSRKQPLAPQVFDLNTLVAGMLDLLEHSVGTRLRLVSELDASPLPVRADPGQLENALMNLVLNSRDATPDGGTISVRTRPGSTHLTPDGSPIEQVVLEVADTGSGMPAEVLERVFEPFYTTKSGGLGTGLGLSMVYGFVKQSGGDIAIDSRPGQGTTVRLSLPRARPSAAVPPDDPAEFAGRTVLVVDDEADVRGAVVGQLRALGVETLAAGSVDEALARLADAHVDLLLTDVFLGAGDTGPQLAARAHARLPTLPVLFSSGHDLGGLAERGVHVAPEHFVPKPANRSTLRERLAALLGHDRSAGTTLL